MSKRNLLIACALVGMAALVRLVPHWPNVVPTVGLAIFAGNVLGNKRLSYGVVLAAMIISDALLGWHDVIWATYLSMALIVLLASKLASTSGLLLGTMASSTLFFVITNFAVWISGWMYPLTGEGFMACFVAAIPFYGYSLAGDLFYTVVLFGTYSVLVHRPLLAKANI